MADKTNSVSAAIVVAAIVLVFVAKSCSWPDTSPGYDQLAVARGRAAAASAAAQRKSDCISSRDSMIAAYTKHYGERRYDDAARSIGECHSILGDAELVRLVADAEQKSLVEKGLNTKLAIDEREAALLTLSRHYPEAAKPHAQLLEGLSKKVQAANALAAKKAEASRLAARKREGVSLGMTQQEVLESSWGRPEKVNRSTYTFGVHEQWVYGGGYLYFKDGILDSIQN